MRQFNLVATLVASLAVGGCYSGGVATAGDMPGELMEIVVTDFAFYIEGRREVNLADHEDAIAEHLRSSGRFGINACGCTDTSRLVETMGYLSERSARQVTIIGLDEQPQPLCTEECN